MSQSIWISCNFVFDFILFNKKQFSLLLWIDFVETIWKKILWELLYRAGVGLPRKSRRKKCQLCLLNAMHAVCNKVNLLGNRTTIVISIHSQFAQMPQNIELDFSEISTFLDYFCLLSGVLASLPVDQLFESILCNLVFIPHLYSCVREFTNKTALIEMFSYLSTLQPKYY